MRWLYVPELETGTTRERLRFAWWPTTMSDKKTEVWLERYVAVEYYQRGYGDMGGGWTSSHWVESGRRLSCQCAR